MLIMYFHLKLHVDKEEVIVKASVDEVDYFAWLSVKQVELLVVEEQSVELDVVKSETNGFENMVINPVTKESNRLTYGTYLALKTIIEKGEF